MKIHTTRNGFLRAIEISPTSVKCPNKRIKFAKKGEPKLNQQSESHSNKKQRSRKIENVESSSNFHVPRLPIHRRTNANRKISNLQSKCRRVTFKRSRDFGKSKNRTDLSVFFIEFFGDGGLFVHLDAPQWPPETSRGSEE